MENREQLHRELLQEWKTSKGYTEFCNDGILIEKEYDKSTPKILFLLKETHDSFVNIGGHVGIPNNTNKIFWRMINIWLYVITETWNERIPDFEKVSIIKEREVNSIAMVNVKKNANGTSKSYRKDILSYAIADKEFLVRQIELINPDVIYCGGTLESFMKLFEYETINRHIYTSNKRLIISHHHPSSVTGYREPFEFFEYCLSKNDCQNAIKMLKAAKI